MKYLFIIFSLVFSLSSCKQEVEYNVLFKSRPYVYGNTPVFAGAERIGYSSGQMQQIGPDLFTLPVKIEKRYSLIMTSDLYAVIVNGAIDLRELRSGQARSLPPGAGITGFCSEWDYNLFILGSKGKECMELINSFLKD